MAINKVVFGNEIQMDLTEDTVTEDKVLEGETFHDRSGNRRTGNLVIPVQDVEVNGESIVDAEGVAEVVVPVSGDVSVTDSFESYTGGKVKSVQMELSPIQDLHGYSEPWVGGSRKNKCPLTVDGIKSANTTVTWNGNSCVFNGVTITILTDEDNNVIGLKFLGTTSQYFYFNVNSNFTIDGTYIISPLPQGAAYSSAFYGRLYYTDGTDTGFLSSEVTVTKQNAVGRMQIVVSTNVTVDFTYQPMLRLSTESDPTFEPYSNICPISAHTQAKLEQRGKNRAISPENGVFSGVNGAFNPTDTYAYVVADVEPNKLYTVSAEHRGGIGYVLFYKGTLDTPVTNFISAISIGDVASYTFTTPEECTIVVYETGGSSIPINKDTIGNVQIELGSTATDYEPYQGKDYIINLGGSYYWVRGDVVSGKWYVIGQSVDLGTLSWTKDSSKTFYAFITDSLTGLQDMWCEVLNPYPENYKLNEYNNYPDNIIARNATQKNVYVKCTTYEDGTASDFRTAMSGYKLVYKLATPIPINLDPQQIEAFLGENNFSAPLEHQEIIEIIARNIAEFNEVIDDENISDKFTYSSEKIEDRLDEYVDKDAVEEKSATDEFTTINGGLLSECKVSLTPNQDLHGYDNPWVGGAGKNKFEVTATTATEQGVLFNVNSDGTITTTRQSASSNNASIILGDFTLPVGSYKINGANNAGSGGYFTLRKASDNTFIVNIESSGYDLNVTDATFEYRLTCVVQSAVSPTGDYTTVKPMIRLATESDPTFAPYSNICPISGHTQVDVENHQKNLCNNSANIIGLWESDGTYHDNLSYRTSDLIEVSANTEYSVSLFDLSTNTRVNGLVVTEWDANSEIIRQVDGNTLTTTANTKYVRIRNYGANSALVKTSNYAYQLELGSTATPYVPYNGYQVTVNLGGTYYSGTLDVVSGVFTPDTASVDLETLGWAYNASRATFEANISGIKYDYNDRYHLIMPNYKFFQGSPNVMPDFSYTCSNNTTEIYVKNSLYGSDTVSFIASMTGYIGVYELATPTSIQLSPTMVKALVGENHLSAPLEGQEITESEYRELFTWDEVEEIAQKIADSKIDDRNISYDTTFSSHIIENRYAKKIWDVPVLTPYYQVSAGATEVTFTNQFIFSDYQTSCELIQIGGGPRVGISDVVISMGSVKFTFDAPLTALTRFVCSIMNFY